MNLDKLKGAPVLVVTGKLAAEAAQATLARSTPGFIVNRIARPYYAETLAASSMCCRSGASPLSSMAAGTCPHRSSCDDRSVDSPSGSTTVSAVRFNARTRIPRHGNGNRRRPTGSPPATQPFFLQRHMPYIDNVILGV